MLRFAFRYIAGAFAFPLADYLLFGLWCRDMNSALLAGASLMLFYLLLRPLMRLVSLAFSLLTLGLFSIVIDTALILLTVRLFPQAVRVKGPEWAALAAVVINVVRFISGRLVKA